MIHLFRFSLIRIIIHFTGVGNETLLMKYNVCQLKANMKDPEQIIPISYLMKLTRKEKILQDHLLSLIGRMKRD